MVENKMKGINEQKRKKGSGKIEQREQNNDNT